MPPPRPEVLHLFLSEAGERAKAAIIISGIPAGQDYAQFVRELDEIERSDLRVMGPNCMGVYSAPPPPQAPE